MMHHRVFRWLTSTLLLIGGISFVSTYIFQTDQATSLTHMADANPLPIDSATTEVVLWLLIVLFTCILFLFGVKVLIRLSLRQR